MKVLLTGANGFVGSHIVDSLCGQGISTVLLLRPNSDRTFLQQRLGQVEIRPGSISDSKSLSQALSGITHVIHCAGCTKTVRVSGFFETNQLGTRTVVEALHSAGSSVRRLIHISSLAAAGPATPNNPVQESDRPNPISQYGSSKLAAEQEVKERCRTEYVILRPPAVYGPRDRGFLPLFKAVKNHLLPLTNQSQALSLVFVRDLASVIMACLDHPRAAGQTYFVAPPQSVTGRKMAEEIATQMKSWTIPLPMPAAALWPVCLMQDLLARVTGKPALLSLAKFPELVAPGWVCSPSRAEQELGLKCTTSLSDGIAQTLKWYRNNTWL